MVPYEGERTYLVKSTEKVLCSLTDVGTLQTWTVVELAEGRVMLMMLTTNPALFYLSSVETKE